MEFSKLVGLTITHIENDNNQAIIFTTDSGDVYKLFHEQDCCESVHVDDIEGFLGDLIGNPILQAEESSDGKKQSEDYGTETWTFYKLATIKGYVTIKWYGSSNGYYSESVDIVKRKKDGTWPRSWYDDED